MIDKAKELSLALPSLFASCRSLVSEFDFVIRDKATFFDLLDEFDASFKTVEMLHVRYEDRLQSFPELRPIGHDSKKYKSSIHAAYHSAQTVREHFKRILEWHFGLTFEGIRYLEFPIRDDAREELLQAINRNFEIAFKRWPIFSDEYRDRALATLIGGLKSREPRENSIFGWRLCQPKHAEHSCTFGTKDCGKSSFSGLRTNSVISRQERLKALKGNVI